MGNLSGEAKAPAALSLGAQLNLSAFNSASVGKRNPLGHGLFVPDVPCHKLSGLEPVYQLEDPERKLLPGEVEELVPAVAAFTGVPAVVLVQLINSCPSAPLPH